ncbi:MAG TPA: metallophosphoesterase family protein [Puia sp.]|nr:metallophosphoesterase family protein [Puia sp.]
MKRIGLLSDTHGYLDENIFRHFERCDEIWHAGDIGNADLSEKLSAFKPLRAVYGNIDGYDIRSIYPEKLRWSSEEVKVLMMHIGGYPPRYNPAAKKELAADPPQLFICGHSHILRIMFDPRINCLFMNPGAAGKHGWHKIRTLVRFTVDGKEIRDCEVVELGLRNQIS